MNKLRPGQEAALGVSLSSSLPPSHRVEHLISGRLAVEQEGLNMRFTATGLLVCLAAVVSRTAAENQALIREKFRIWG